jgi:DNA-binding LacI/PurR family transcriptional regulator
MSFSSLRASNRYFYLDILARIEQETVAVGYDLLLSSSADKRFDDYIISLKRRRVAGVLMIAPDERMRMLKLINADIPTVFIDTLGQGKRATYVKADNIGGTRQAVEHLLALGHRRIAILTGYMTSLSGTERLLGSQQALASAGVALDPQLIHHTGFGREESYRAVCALLDKRRDFTAIVAPSDIVALSALRALHERNIHVPDDVSIVGFDDIDFCLDVYPQLTTVRPDHEVMGQKAVHHLLSIINGATDVAPLIASTQLVIRASTGPVSSAS